MKINMFQSINKILIVGAMIDVELKYLINRLKNCKKTIYPVCTIYEGILYNKNIILCDSGIGLINTSSSITFAIEKYHPDIIIDQGCAGGFSTDIHKSDIVVGISCINITSILTKHKEIGEGSNLDDWELINYLPGQPDRLVCQEGSRQLINFIKQNQNEYKYGKIHFGVIGSGDIWNKECDRIIYLNKMYKILCEDMEGIAVYTVANNYNIPAIDIRIISDNEILKEEYDRNVAIKAQEFILKLLELV